jgi:hypothetical protein
MKKRRKYNFSSTGICLGYTEVSVWPTELKRFVVIIASVVLLLVSVGYVIATSEFPTLTPATFGELPALSR